MDVGIYGIRSTSTCGFPDVWYEYLFAVSRLNISNTHRNMDYESTTSIMHRVPLAVRTP